MFYEHHDVATSLARLERVEARLSDHIPPAKGPYFFRFTRDRLVREDLLLAQLLKGLTGHGAAVPGVSGLAPVRLAAARFSGDRFKIRSSAYAIAFRRNTRAFYGGSKRCTLKIPAPGISGELLRNEVAVRNDLGVPRSVSIPALIDWDLDDADPYLLEEAVIGWRPRGKRAEAWLTSSGLPSILDFYEENGVSLAPAGELLDPVELARKIESIARRAAWAPKDSGLEAFLTSITGMSSQLDGTVVVVAGHGDLALDNILLGDDGRIFLLDWECAGRVTIYHDLLKLLRLYPKLGDLVEARFEKWFTGAERQKLLAPTQHALMSKLHRIGRRFDDWRAAAQADSDAATRMAAAFIQKAARDLSEIEAGLRVLIGAQE